MISITIDFRVYVRMNPQVRNKAPLTNVEFREAFDVTRGWVSVNRTEVAIELWGEFSLVRTKYGKKYAPGNLNLSFGCQVLEVLIAEDKDFAFGSIECEFIKSFLAELTDLDAFNNGSQVRIQVGGSGILQQVWLSLVSA